MENLYLTASEAPTTEPSWIDVTTAPKKGAYVELELDDGTIVDSVYDAYNDKESNKFWNWRGVTYSMGKPKRWRQKHKKQSVVIDNLTTRNEEFEGLCRMTQSELKTHLQKKYNMESGDGYLYHKGTIPILLTAHMDTVHANPVASIVYANGTISSDEGIGGDDRCGIYMIEHILPTYDCSVLFFEDEEIGSVGAGKFIKTDLCASLVEKFKYIIELDRANAKDAVYYECDNKSFKDYISTFGFWKEAHGTWSDCCTIGPQLNSAIVNFSCGYYKAHTTNEYVVLDEMDSAITAIRVLLADNESAEFYNYIKAKRSASAWSRSYGYWDDDYYNYYGDKLSKTTSVAKPLGELELTVLTADGFEEVVKGNSKYECWAKFFINHSAYSYDDVMDYEWR